MVVGDSVSSFDRVRLDKGCRPEEQEEVRSGNLSLSLSCLFTYLELGRAQPGQPRLERVRRLALERPTPELGRPQQGLGHTRAPGLQPQVRGRKLERRGEPHS